MRFQHKIGYPVVFEGIRFSFQLPGYINQDSDSIKSGFVSALIHTSIMLKVAPAQCAAQRTDMQKMAKVSRYKCTGIEIFSCRN